MKKAIVLLSGGLDSTVSTRRALDLAEVTLALTFDYGQKALPREITAARKLASVYKIPHRVIELPWYREILAGALVDRAVAIPELTNFSLQTTQQTARQVWVYNRNGLFINIAAVYAEKYGCDTIVTGFNAEEAQTFPDNTLEFCQAITHSLSFSTQNHSQVISYTQSLTKPQIVSWAVELGIPLENVWSCYTGEEQMCGSCESCQRFKSALAENNLYEKAATWFVNQKLLG